MITPYRQYMTLKRVVDSGLYGDTYEVVERVPCRYSKYNRVVHIAEGTDRGREIISDTLIQTKYPLKILDKIILDDGVERPILKINEVVGVGGSTIEYEVYV